MKDKDTIFLSHSSKDKEALNILKKLLMEKTSSIYNVFLSSDGQSIPFGTNWVHKIEAGLNKAKVMFIFVTINSVKSGWIYFEAGYAYSKGIKVIPVGIGVDIGSINPPLNMLQGFNITSEEGLNNIVKTINDVFNVTFPENFIENEFDLFSERFNLNDNQRIANNIIDGYEARLNNKWNYDDALTAFDLVIEIFKKNYESYNICNKQLLSKGISIEGINDSINVSFDADNFINNLDTFKMIIKQLHITEDDSHYIYINFKPSVHLISDNVKISSIISKSDYITFGEDSINSYKYNNLKFKVTKKSQTENRLAVIITQEIANNDISNLVNELLRIGIIYIA